MLISFDKSKARMMLTVLILGLTLIFPVLAAPKVNLPHYPTWDSDMINVEDVLDEYDGSGVYVAVLDTGLVPNWRDYFPTNRIATNLGIGFVEELQWDPKLGDFADEGILHTTTFVGEIGSSHGTHVVSTILGYNYYAPIDAAQSFNVEPVFVEGIAPQATIIPVKVLTTYTIPADPKAGTPKQTAVFGTDRAVAAGIDYVTELKKEGLGPIIISMSLGGDTATTIIEEAIDNAIAAGVIVVAAAGNAGDAGMDWPGAYPQVISVGACGWKYEWYGSGYVAPPPRNRMWWLQYGAYYNDVTEINLQNEIYITDFSGREKAGQQLDVVAPGSWVRGPFESGYSHLPWWSNGIGWLKSVNPDNYYYVGGTSMATPHVSAIIALMLDKNPTLAQAQVETILKGTALPISAGSMLVWDLSPTQGWYTYSWGLDATGSGLVQADAALATTP